MMFYLIFSGLIAFAPASDGKTVWVVLPQEASHYAVLRVKEDNCCDGGRSPDFWISETLTGPREAVFVIAGFDIGFEMNSPEPLTIIRGRRREGLRKPCVPGTPSCQGMPHSYLEQKRDFGWVMEMPSVIPGVERMNPKCLTPRLNEGPSEVGGVKLRGCPAVARLRLTQGTLQTLRLEGDEGTDEIKPTEVDTFGVEKLTPIQPDSQARAVARKVELQIGQITGAPKITLTSLGSGQTEVIALKPDPSGQVFATLENLPLHDVVLPTRRLAAADMTGNHFKAFYQLSMWVPPEELKSGVIRQARERIADQIMLLPHANERICPMTTFKID